MSLSLLDETVSLKIVEHIYDSEIEKYSKVQHVHSSLVEQQQKYVQNDNEAVTAHKYSFFSQAFISNFSSSVGRSTSMVNR